MRPRMRHKRFQNHVETMCDMFCGWRLANSIDELSRLVPGKIEIDVLSEQCWFNGSPINSLNMASELSIWLRKDLQQYKIPVEALQTASVTADIQIVSFIVGTKKRKPSRMWKICCRSVLATDEQTYSSDLVNTSWPAIGPADANGPIN